MNEPDHTLPGRAALGFDGRRGASYNAEYVYADKRWAVNLTGIGGCQGGLIKGQEFCENKGFVGYSAHLTWSPNKIVTTGLSNAFLTKIILEEEDGEEESKLLNAVSWVVGTKQYYTLGELALASLLEKEETTYQGWVDFMLVPVRGLSVGYSLKLYQGNRKVYGTKAVWLPVAGLEFNFSWMREFSTEANADTFLFLTHAYL